MKRHKTKTHLFSSWHQKRSFKQRSRAVVVFTFQVQCSLLLLWGSTNGHVAFGPHAKWSHCVWKFSCLVPRKVETRENRWHFANIMLLRGQTLTTNFLKSFGSLYTGQSFNESCLTKQVLAHTFYLVQRFSTGTTTSPVPSLPSSSYAPLLCHLEPPAVQWIYYSFCLTLLGFHILFCFALMPNNFRPVLDLSRISTQKVSFEPWVKSIVLDLGILLRFHDIIAIILFLYSIGYNLSGTNYLLLNSLVILMAAPSVYLFFVVCMFVFNCADWGNIHIP